MENRIRYIGFLFVILSTSIVFAKPSAAPSQVKSETNAAPVLELQSLEIQAKIHEPTLIYIMDKPDFHIPYEEEDLKLSPWIETPLERNALP